MTSANPNTPTTDTSTSEDSIQPWMLFGFVLAVLVVVVVAVVYGIDTNELTGITAATVAIVGAGVAAFKVRR